MPAIVRRSDELSAIAAAIDDAATGTRAVLIEGEAGIGKTTLWRFGVQRATEAGHHVAIARVGELETKLSYSALGDLFDDVPEETVATLPPPQRKALDLALLRAETNGIQPDPRAVALGALGALRTIAAERPVLLAIDDIQWLDSPSAQVLRFVVRRLKGHPIGVLATMRLGDGLTNPVPLDGAGPDGAQRIFVGPLPADAFGKLIRERLGTEVPHTVAERVHEASGGNPFFGLEIARELSRRGALAPGASLPLPDDATALVRTRISHLSPDSRRALCIAAAAARPTVSLVSDAGLGAASSGALAEAEEAGVIRMDGGRITFTHPLMASAVYTFVSAPVRREIHRRIAEHVDDPEESARHLALSSSGPDEEVASSLDEAAIHARGRGAPAAAAELSLLARSLTGDDAEHILDRTVEAAMFSFEAGDAGQADALLEEAIARAEPGPDRAMLLLRLSEISWQDTARVEALSEQALEEAGDDRTCAALAHGALAWVWTYRGDLARAMSHAKSARSISRFSPDAAIDSEVFGVLALAEFLTGTPSAETMAEAIRQQDLLAIEQPTLTGTVYSAPRVVHGLTTLWAGELEIARELLDQELVSYDARGRYVARDELLCYLANLSCRTGEWDRALSYAQECLEIGEESGHLRGRGQNLFPRAWVRALRGELHAARLDAEEGLRLSLRNQDLLAAACNRGVLGLVCLTEADPQAAVEHLRPVVSLVRSMGSPEPGVVPFVADAVEALVAIGELDEASAIVADDQLMGRLVDRPASAATAERSSGLLLAARGDLAGARDALERALKEHARAPRPFELARTLLVHGEVARRSKRRAVARASLEEAATTFNRLGASAWETRARAGLARVSSAATIGDQLSPTQHRIAEVVAQGKTNREVAELLFISVKTVEANLSRIYQKLGVRSRSELVRALASAEAPA